MGYIQRTCDNCDNSYSADERNLNRGWGLCCSKSCAAKLREKNKPSYNESRVESNNIRRNNWNNPFRNETPPSVHGGSGKVTGITSEGYRVMDGVAYDEFDDPIYNVTGETDEGDSMYYNSKDY